jgi:rhodanese-related sulfurtransferase
MLPKDAHAKKEEVGFLDVREPNEFQAGHIEGSLHIPLMQLPARFAELDRSGTWVVVCQVGQRSDMASRFLRGQGYDSHNLDGGLEGWLRAGLEISNGSGERGRLKDGYGRVLEWLPQPD